MKRFRLPRRLKKHLKKTMWLYPENEEGNFQVASPARNIDDLGSFVPKKFN